GQTIGALATKWRDAPIMKSSGIADAVGPVLDRVRALQAVEGSTDQSQLQAAVVSAPPGSPELVLGAWRRLGVLDHPAWPADLKQLDDDRKLHDRVDAAVGQITDTARTEVLRQQVAREKGARWQRFFMTVRQPADIEAAVDRMSAFGVTPD